MDAYLEEELYDILTYCIQNPNASDLGLKRTRVEEIGKELHSDVGLDSMENMLYSIEFRIKDELKKDATTKNIPVIVLSSLPQKNAEKLKQSGAAAYFEKATLGVENGSTCLIRAIEDVLRSPQAACATASL